MSENIMDWRNNLKNPNVMEAVQFAEDQLLPELSKNKMNQSVLDAVKFAEEQLLPVMSKKKYNKAYGDFATWKMQNHVTDNSEEMLLAYFFGLSEQWAPTSLWAYFSMLKSTLKLNDNVDIGGYHKLAAFIKNKNCGYKPIQAKVFSMEQIDRFLMEASDLVWLDVKVVCIFGIKGALRTDELTRITINDIEKHGDELFMVIITETKTKISKSFAIKGDYYSIVKKYRELRSPRTVDNRFFVNYRNGRCTIQPIGQHKFSKMPGRIASFLKLEEPGRYTGHSFRRSSATILANAGASMEWLMRHGGWKSSKVAEQYVEKSIPYKTKTADMISSTVTSTKITTSTTATTSNGNITQDYASTKVSASQGYLDNVVDDSDTEDLTEFTSAEEGTFNLPMNELARIAGKNSGSHEGDNKTFSFSNCSITFNMK